MEKITFFAYFITSKFVAINPANLDILLEKNYLFVFITALIGSDRNG